MRQVGGIVLALLLAAEGCGTPAARDSALRTPQEAELAGQFLANAPGDPVVRTELFFGLSKPDGSTVTDAEWQAFLDDTVTPRFPDGLTVFSAQGQYKSREGNIVKEPARVVVILHGRGAPEETKIEEVREIYKKRFDQESVLRITTVSKAAF